MTSLVVRGIVGLLYVILVVPASMLLFIPVLWPFAVLVTTGSLVSPTTFGQTLVAMCIGWGLLFLFFRGLVALRARDGDEMRTVLNEEFTAASHSGDNLRAAWILFLWYWKQFPRAFGKQSHG